MKTMLKFTYLTIFNSFYKLEIATLRGFMPPDYIETNPYVHLAFPFTVLIDNNKTLWSNDDYYQYIGLFVFLSSLLTYTMSNILVSNLLWQRQYQFIKIICNNMQVSLTNFKNIVPTSLGTQCKIFHITHMKNY